MSKRRDCFFDVNNKPVCPIAVEVIPDYFNEPREGVALYAAEELGCTPKEVWVFIYWWDMYSYNTLRERIIKV